MNSKDTRSSQDLRREVLNDLNRVNRDIDSIQRRMTPGQLIDDAIFYSHGSNPSAVFDHLKRNPVGTTFLVVGTFLLMEDEKHRSYELTLKQSSRDAFDLTRNTATGMMAEARHKVDQVKGQIKQKVDHYHNRKDAEAAFGKGPSKVEQIKEKVTEKMGEVKSTIQEKIPEMKENLSHPMDTVKDFHPMTFIALGAGLGALSGAALPVSEKERKFVDHKFRSKIDQFTQEIQQALNESVVILKDEFLTELKNVDVGIFKGQDNLSDTIPTPGL